MGVWRPLVRMSLPQQPIGLGLSRSVRDCHRSTRKRRGNDSAASSPAGVRQPSVSLSVSEQPIGLGFPRVVCGSRWLARQCRNNQSTVSLFVRVRGDCRAACQCRGNRFAASSPEVVRGRCRLARHCRSNRPTSSSPCECAAIARPHVGAQQESAASLPMGTAVDAGPGGGAVGSIGVSATRGRDMPCACPCVSTAPAGPFGTVPPVTAAATNPLRVPR